jgi:aspartokinase/homoserine dehydrogenase 1
VVDVTATDETIPALLVARERGYKIALANKKPLTDTQEVYNRLTQAGITDGERATHFQQSVRWEATVGAGLPVIATQNRLMASGDEITRMAGAFSGTLGYIMTGLQAGRRLSEIVREAHQLGYTEPDPRDDLSGMDVARKALILARGVGWELELSDVDVTGLYPPNLDDLSVDEFLDALPELDKAMDATIRDAAARDGVLRYAATVENGRCYVGPTVVSADSPLGRLTGTDNLAEFHSRWYSPNPLVLQGRGAGVDATAAGVLSDIIELAFTSE